MAGFRTTARRHHVRRTTQRGIESLPSPKDWAESVQHEVLNIVGIVRLAMLSGRELLIQQRDVRQTQIHRLETEVALLREELRIVAARMNRIDSYTASNVYHLSRPDAIKHYGSSLRSLGSSYLDNAGRNI